MKSLNVKLKVFHLKIRCKVDVDDPIQFEFPALAKTNRNKTIFIFSIDFLEIQLL